MKVTVIRGGQAKEYEIGSNNDLLVELEDAGARMPYGCRAGACGACRVLVRAGAELLIPPDVMEAETLSRCGGDSSLRLACRALTTGSGTAITLEIPSEEE